MFQDAGVKAAAMAAGAAASGTFLQLRDGRFIDDRWVNGRWDLSMFKNAAGETDWDAVSSTGMYKSKHTGQLVARTACHAVQDH